MPVQLELISRKYLRNPVFVTIGERTGTVVQRIKQNVIFTTEGQKMRLLTNIVSHEEPPIIVFCKQKKTCDLVVRHLQNHYVQAVALHSGRMQSQREAALEGFRSGQYDVLVATDVACRGIDVRGVTHVINFDMPGDIQTYSHRIGRTGRMGEEGKSTSFLTNEDADIMFDLRNTLLVTDNEVPPELAQHEAAQSKPGSLSASVPKSQQKIFAS